jgi:hypothetical protein
MQCSLGLGPRSLQHKSCSLLARSFPTWRKHACFRFRRMGMIHKSWWDRSRHQQKMYQHTCAWKSRIMLTSTASFCKWQFPPTGTCIGCPVNEKSPIAVPTRLRILVSILSHFIGYYQNFIQKDYFCVFLAFRMKRYFLPWFGMSSNYLGRGTYGSFISFVLHWRCPHQSRPMMGATLVQTDDHP